MRPSSSRTLKCSPARIPAAVLCDTGHKIGTLELWETPIATALNDGIEPMADAILERWFPQHFHAAHPEQLAGWRAMVTRTPGHGYAGTSAALRDADYTSTVTEIGVPVLCLGGEYDLSTPPALMRELTALIPGASFAQVDGAGHLPMIDRPEAVIELIGGFLARALGA